MKHRDTYLILNAIILHLKLILTRKPKHVFQPETDVNVSIPATSVLILPSSRDGTLFPASLFNRLIAF